MPELPEVETVRRGLEPALIGRRVVAVSVGRDRVVRRTSAPALSAGLTGARFCSLGRRGKYLIAQLDTGRALMIHLRMSGQVRLGAESMKRPPHTHVVVGLDDGAEMWFVDPRTFGEMVVFDPDEVASQVPELATLGIDPIVDPFDLGSLRPIVRSRRRVLKALLLDQHLIAGLGNIYTDEILHRARLHPLRRSDRLGPAAEARLYRSIVDTLEGAIDAGGSTLGDAQYVDALGRAGRYQAEHRVYARAGERCRTCGRGIIRRLTVSQRSTHYCPWCQRPERTGDHGRSGP